MKLADLAQQPPLPPAAERSARLVGLRFGSFITLRVLGGGGMGTVLLAKHPLMPKRVAIKVLHEHLAARPLLVARFLAEARAMSLVQHENVITVFDLGAREGLPYFVMEYLEGQTLADFARPPLEPPLAVELLTQVCEALGAVHARGLVHCDLKPANLFLVPRPQGGQRVKLLDFGIARRAVLPPSPVHPVPALAAGPPTLLAPEQCQGRPVDARTDLYAVGVLGHLLLTGQPLLAPTPASPAPLEPSALRRVHAGIPPALAAVLQRALAARPEERFASAAELCAALQASLAPSSAPPLAARLRGTSGPALPCERIGRTGLFLRTEAPAPPLLAEVTLTLLLPGGELPCAGQVVHHVPVEQARARGLAAGFGVQLRPSTPAFEETFHRLLTGPTTPPTERDDEQAEFVLRAFHGRLTAGDHYAFLGLSRGAEPPAIRARARALREQLESLRARALSSRQRLLLERTLERLAHGLRVLGHLERRAEYDAELGNLEGILRCLASGLTATALEACRERFLARRPPPEGHVLLHLVSGDAFLAAGRAAEALEAYGAALRVDPLHLEALKRWHGLRRRGQGGAVTPSRR